MVMKFMVKAMIGTASGETSKKVITELEEEASAIGGGPLEKQ